MPTGAEIEYTSQKLDAPIKIIVYTGADGSFSIYEDEGLNYNYEKGKYSEIPLTFDDASKTLTIGVRKGEFEGMQESRIFEIVFADASSNTTFDFDKLKAKRVEYKGQKIEVAQ